MISILLVEDEAHLAEGLRFNLEAEGYRVEVVDNGEAGLAALADASKRFDLAVLDVMLPGIDGFEVVRTMRERGQFIPVLMLTARGRSEDVLEGFTAGADDYLTKPFELSILIARVGGLLRRRQWLQSAPEVAPVDKFEFAGRVIDFDAMQLSLGDRNLPLTLMEANLLRYLIRHRGRTISRKAILEDVWGLAEDTDTRAIDNFIVRLRRYIENDPSEPKYLLTVRGVGYRFAV